MNRVNKLGLATFLFIITTQLFWERIDTLPKSILFFAVMVGAMLAVSYEKESE